MHRAKERLANMERRHLIIACVVVVVLAAVVVALTVALVANVQKQTPTSTANFSVSGEMTCLPHKGNGPHTLECAYGLRTDDNRHYALQSDTFPTDIQIGERVQVQGSLTTGGDSKYDVVGTIKIESLSKP